MFYVRPFEALAFCFRGRFRRGVLCVCGMGMGEAGEGVVVGRPLGERMHRRYRIYNIRWTPSRAGE